MDMQTVAIVQMSAGVQIQTPVVSKVRIRVAPPVGSLIG